MAFNSNIKISFTLTLSKLFAYLLFVAGITLDACYGLKGQLFMWTVPFSVGLISGKQGFDMLKEWATQKFAKS
jgi:hypothetical protein